MVEASGVLAVASKHAQFGEGGRATGVRDESRAGGFLACAKEATGVDDETAFVPMLAAARALGMSDAALRRRVHRAGLPVYRDRIDLRVRLLRAADVERLREPRWSPDPSSRSESPTEVA